MIGKLRLLVARQALDSSQGFALYGSPDTPSLSILTAFDYLDSSPQVLTLAAISLWKVLWLFVLRSSPVVPNERR